MLHFDDDVDNQVKKLLLLLLLHLHNIYLFIYHLVEIVVYFPFFFCGSLLLMCMSTLHFFFWDRFVSIRKTRKRKAISVTYSIPKKRFLGFFLDMVPRRKMFHSIHVTYFFSRNYFNIYVNYRHTHTDCGFFHNE